MPYVLKMPYDSQKYLGTFETLPILSVEQWWKPSDVMMLLMFRLSPDWHVPIHATPYQRDESRHS